MNKNIDQIQALNHAFSAIEQKLLTDIAALQLREQALSQQLQAGQEQLHRLEQEWAQREKEHAEQTRLAQQELESLLRSQAQREQEVAAQLLAIQQQAAQEMAEQTRSHSEQELALQRQYTEREQALTQQLQTEQEQLHRLEQEWAQREKEHAEQTRLAQQELESLLRSQAQREQEVAAQLLASQQETIKISQKFSEREQELAAQLYSIKSEATKENQVYIAQERELNRQLQTSQQEAFKVSQMLAARERELRGQLQASKQEALKATQTLALRERELGTQLKTSEQETLEVSQQLAMREQELRAQLQYAQTELSELEREKAEQASSHSEQERALQRQHAEREQALSQQLQAAQQELLHLQQDRAQREKEHAEQTRRVQQELESLLRIQAQREQEVAAQLLAIQQQTAHDKVEQARNHNDQEHALQREQALSQQLQQMLNTLQRELITMRNDLSWRLIAPLRAVAGWFKSIPIQTGYENSAAEQLIVETLSHPKTDTTTTGTPKFTSNISFSETHNMNSDSSPQATQPNPSSEAPNLKALLQYQDRQFIEYAYLTLLKRKPDNNGLNYYLNRLRNGVPKIQILGQMLKSHEARANTIELPGLRYAIKLHKLAKLPLVGSILKFFIKIEGNTAFESRLRAVEQHIFLWEKQSNARFEHINHGVNNLQQLIAQQDHQLRAVEQHIFLWEKQSNARFEHINHGVNNLQQLIAQQDHQFENIARQVNDIAQSNATTDCINSSRIDCFTDEPTRIKETSLVCETQQLTVLPATLLSTSFDQLQYRAKCQGTLYYYVDHTIVCPVNTGIQRLVRGLARSLIKNGEQLCFVKWDFNNRELVLIDRDELAHLARWQGPELTPEEIAAYPVAGLAGVAISIHKTGHVNWLVVPEVTHINNHPAAVTLDVVVTAKRLGLKSAFIFYDATPLRRRELAGMAPKHEQYMQQLLLADLIVPISNYSSADLVSFFKLHEHAKLPLPQIHAILLPGEPNFAPRVLNISPGELTNKIILTVGSIVPHKNQVALVRVFDRYCNANPDTAWKLKLIGNLHPELADEIIGTTRTNPRIEYLGDVSDNELRNHYKTCTFTVFPSVIEGFGLPILESLWFAKPCICANFGVMAEVAVGGGCLTVDTSNEEYLFEAIVTLIDQPERILQLSKEATQRSISSWVDYASNFSHTLNMVEDVVQSLGNIYYWIDHTSIYPANSGIQRTVRGLARSLLDQGVSLIPTKWDEEKQCFYPPSPDELEHLSKWNGPTVNKWARWVDPEFASDRDWILIPELTHYLSKTSVDDISNYSRKINVRCAWVFYDAIPWKMVDIYPPEATEAHRKYMLGLSRFEKVFAISNFTRSDLLRFITAQDMRVGNIENRFVKSSLPGEFLGSERVMHRKVRIDTGKLKILCVGTVEPRKNHLGLLEALLEAKRRTSVQIDLVIAGGGPFPELASQVEQLITKSSGIIWNKKVDDKTLAQLYSDCDITIFPSIEEGFGLPILESLWNSRPCICANFGAMAEAAEGGGCLTLDVRNPAVLTNAILKLAEDDSLLQKLNHEAIKRTFKTWREYGREIAVQLATERYIGRESDLLASCDDVKQLHELMVNLDKRPTLSICISTYNRAGWLALSLKNLYRLLPVQSSDIEIVIVDNASTDSTPEVIKPFLPRSNFHYFRNSANVGMLGNLRETANHARGQYIWILGDDDLVLPGGIETVLSAILANPGIALFYLNYAYTRVDDSNAVNNLDNFLAESTPIMPSCPDLVGKIRQICTQSENFFTAIYCLVFRRDHAIRAYSQNTDGRPFSTMLTCIPTTYYVLNYMMDEPAYWIGEPQLVVNLNVSWMKYAPLWILERIPEVYDTAERLGADPVLVDRWRINNMLGVLHFFKEIFDNDPEGNGDFVSVTRLINRLKHLNEFKEIVFQLKDIYEKAYKNNHPLALLPSAEVFSAF